MGIDDKDKNENSERLRDFGDSAGYGERGSTLDRNVVGDDGPPAEGRPNPLDAVVKPKPAPNDATDTET